MRAHRYWQSFLQDNGRTVEVKRPWGDDHLAWYAVGAALEAFFTEIQYQDAQSKLREITRVCMEVLHRNVELNTAIMEYMPRLKYTDATLKILFEHRIEELVEDTRNHVNEHRAAKWEPNGWDGGSSFVLAYLRRRVDELRTDGRSEDRGGVLSELGAPVQGSQDSTGAQGTQGKG